MKAIESIQYYIDKTMMEDGEFYSSVITYLSGKKDEKSAQIVLWELSQSEENGMFFSSLYFADFKLALDNISILRGRGER